MSTVVAGVESARPLDAQRTLMQDASSATEVFKIVLEGQASPPIDLPQIPSATDDEATLHESIHDALSDWSGTGRGSHVYFEQDETVPLVEGPYLGSGSFGLVYETTIRGHKLAWKRIGSRQPIVLDARNEIEILRRARHKHVVQLIGAYVHQQVLGILMYPAAVCDLEAFFKAVEVQAKSGKDTPTNQLARLKYSVAPDAPGKIPFIYARLGCLVSAVAYLHKEKIRHKDLKPSNILLCEDQIFLSDFGTATDFSLLSQSATDNTRGTPIYFAPEVDRQDQAGRAADVFSLGCVMLEILIMHSEGTLDRLPLRRTQNKTYQANLKELDTWLPYHDDLSPRRFHLVREVRGMLSKEPSQRPTASKLLRRMQICDEIVENITSFSIFSACCRKTRISTSQHKEQIDAIQHRVVDLESRLVASEAKSTTNQDALQTANVQLQVAQARITEFEEREASTEAKVRELETAHKNIEKKLDRNDAAYEHLQGAYRKEKEAHAQSVAALNEKVATMADLQDKIAQLTKLEEEMSLKTPNSEKVAVPGQIGVVDGQHMSASKVPGEPSQAEPEIKSALQAGGRTLPSPIRQRSQTKLPPRLESKASRDPPDSRPSDEPLAKSAVRTPRPNRREPSMPASRVRAAPYQSIPSNTVQKDQAFLEAERNLAKPDYKFSPRPPRHPLLLHGLPTSSPEINTSPVSSILNTLPTLPSSSSPPGPITTSQRRDSFTDPRPAPPQPQLRPQFRGDQTSTAIRTRPLYTSPVAVKPSGMKRLVRLVRGKDKKKG